MTKKKTSIKEYIGTWRIMEMDQWDMDYIDMEPPSRIVINKKRSSELFFSLKGSGPLANAVPDQWLTLCSVIF